MWQYICLFGDSIAWGAWDRQKGGWVNRLRNYFDIKGNKIIVYNCAIDGDTTSNLLKRFNTECKARKPNIIIFAIGLNDSFYYGSKDKPNTPIKIFENNLQQLINEAKKYCSKIIFIGLTPIDENKTKPVAWEPTIFHDQENTDKYNKIIKKVSEKNRVYFIDIINILDICDIADGIHLNSQGHQKVFLKIKKFLYANKFAQ